MSQKDTYVAQLEAQIDEWSAKMDRLTAKAKAVSADARDAAQKQIADAKARLDVARQGLDTLKGVGSDTWEATKATVDGFWRETKAVLERANLPRRESEV